MLTTDVLVIGAGLMGCATAYELASRGASVLVAERNAAPGRETTARSGAIIRAHYGVPELVQLANEANRRFLDFEAIYGGSAGYNECGYAVLVNEADTGTLRANIALHQSLGVNVALLVPESFAPFVPGLKVHDIALIAYEPRGGYADPALTVASLHAAAQRRGAQFFFDSPVLGARAKGNGWRVKLDNDQEVCCGQVVITTGNWSNATGQIFGLDLPVVPMRAQIAVVERASEYGGPMPVVSDLINLAYFRSDGATGMWVGSSDSADLQDYQPVPRGVKPIPHQEEADAASVHAAKSKAALRFKGIDAEDKGGIQRAFCGLYETTPDWQPIIDSFETVHVAVGFSGHGFKLSPVIGEDMALRVLGEPSPHPTGIFDLDRFAAGRPVKSKFSYERAKFLR